MAELRISDWNSLKAELLRWNELLDFQPPAHHMNTDRVY